MEADSKGCQEWALERCITVHANACREVLASVQTVTIGQVIFSRNCSEWQTSKPFANQERLGGEKVLLLNRAMDC